ncbi:MAG: hypothetical protein BGO26_02975 [Actinobacteria bacterium 69-20]|jgi:hypothetical protein|nr:hypothetical protein [Actinomycetota bacterium]OJV30955.1 MAG: hypothetical protein BGO26_02975 [Actinobacteria bacterium 69-20]
MRTITILGYVVCGLALLAIELLARFTRVPVPTLAALFRWMLRRRSAQIGIIMAWWWIGWHFLGDGA